MLKLEKMSPFVQIYQISENTLYLVDKNNLTPFQTYFVVIFHVKIRKYVTVSIHFKDSFKTFKSDKIFE